MTELEHRLGYTFSDPDLLTNALTHRSYVNEHRKEGLFDNERLEYLGDAVLELCASEYLYETFERMPEGEMTLMRAAMVCEKALAERAVELGIQEQLRLGKGEEKSGGRSRPSLTSDAVEAVIGAIYLDGGFEAAKGVIRKRILQKDIKAGDLSDHKTVLQEILQADGKQCTYRLLKEEGPDHDKTFYMEVLIDGRLFGTGRGRTKKEAEQDAAAKAAEQYRKT